MASVNESVNSKMVPEISLSHRAFQSKSCLGDAGGLMSGFLRVNALSWFAQDLPSFSTESPTSLETLQPWENRDSGSPKGF